MSDPKDTDRPGDVTAETVRQAAAISQAMWEEARRVFTRTGEYPALLLLAEHGLYGRLLHMARRGTLAGWGPDPTGATAVIGVPGGTALMMGGSTMSPGTWMVLRQTDHAGGVDW